MDECRNVQQGTYAAGARIPMCLLSPGHDGLHGNRREEWGYVPRSEKSMGYYVICGAGTWIPA